MRIDNNHYFNQAKQNIERVLGNISAQRAIDSKDTANLAIADQLRSSYLTTDQGIANAYDAVGVMQIADSALSNVTKSVDRLAELSVELGNSVLSESQKQMLYSEANSITQSIRDTYNNTQYNGKNIFQRLDFVTGEEQVETAILNPVSPNNMSIDNIDTINEFTLQINTLRADLGSVMTGIERNINSNTEKSINLKAAEGNLQNDDVPENMYEFHKDFLTSKTNAFVLSHEIQYLQNKMMNLLF